MENVKTQRDRAIEAVRSLMPQASLDALSNLEAVVAEFGTAGDDGSASDAETVKIRQIAQRAASLMDALADMQIRPSGT